MAHHSTPIIPPGGSIWKKHQADFKKARLRRKIIRVSIKLAFFISVCIFALYGVFSWFLHDNRLDPGSSDSNSSEHQSPDNRLLDLASIRQLIQNHSLINLPQKRIHIKRDGKTYTIDTSIDIPLQNHLLKKMDRKNSRHIGMVVLESSTGSVLAMAGFDKKNSQYNTCLDNRYPAASIFKIVTAAAAVEECGLNSNSKLKFNGAQHTLYKRQLKEQSNKYTNHISFRDSFAKSVNPVFGKIGTLKLGKKTLENYAQSFGFNTEINFEKPLSPSHLAIGEDPYNWAEIASGFNRDTTMSPLHGALLAAIILNKGKRIQPSIIEKITIDSGQPVYPDRSNETGQVISPATSRVVYDLMEATIRYGTSSKAFKGYRNDPVLSKLNIGGKTGSIFDSSHELRYDWFVGFADVKNGGQQMAVAIVVAHEEYIGIRASQYARMAMKKYFTDFFKKDFAQTHAEQSG
jgi:cell division protein FtsI/penicillin-binding protein 2